MSNQNPVTVSKAPFYAIAAKAVVAFVITAISILLTILGTGQDLGDLSFTQWLGGVLLLGAAYGFTYAVPNRR